MVWSTPDRSRHFIIPDAADIPPGDLVLRTATGRERRVREDAIAPYEVTEAEAKAWARAQLSDTFGEMRGTVLDFAAELRARAAGMREESQKAWDEGVANAPPELRDAAHKARSGLRDLGQTLQRIAREGLERAEAERRKADERRKTDDDRSADDPNVPPRDDPDSRS